MNAFDRAVDRSVLTALDRARDAMRMRQPDNSWNELCREVNPAEVIEGLRAEQKPKGAALEACQQLDRRQQRTTGNSAWLPWETLAYHTHRHRASQQTRADLVGTTTAGGYLVETLNFSTAAEALLSMLVLGRLGATSIDVGGPNYNLPKVTTSGTPYWLATETSTITESDQVIGQLGLEPHTVGGYTEMSRLLTLQSMPSAAGLVANDLSRKIAREIERVAFAGSGAGGVPHGLTGLSGVNAVSGATYALATGMTAVTDTGDALHWDSSPGFVTTRAVASLLRARQEFTGSSLTLWTGAIHAGQLHNFNAFSTSGVASATAFFGNWAYMVIASWAGGLEISVNPFANFQEGIIGMRALATLDIGVTWPAAFSCITSIS